MNLFIFLFNHTIKGIPSPPQELAEKGHFFKKSFCRVGPIIFFKITKTISILKFWPCFRKKIYMTV